MDSKAIIICNTAPFVRLVIQMFEFASQTSISAGYYKCRVIRSLFLSCDSVIVLSVRRAPAATSKGRRLAAAQFRCLVHSAALSANGRLGFNGGDPNAQTSYIANARPRGRLGNPTNGPSCTLSSARGSTNT